LQVIGAGWGRTSTFTLKVELERVRNALSVYLHAEQTAQLVFGPCYHMSKVDYLIENFPFANNTRAHQYTVHPNAKVIFTVCA
jgi:hypothetical protein